MNSRGEAPLPVQIGRYQIRTLIGRGGMGEVYGAYDPSLDRLVALKTIVAGSDNPSLVERLQREARACGRLHHPGIVTIHDLGESQGTVFIAMEWLQGQSLADAMNGGALSFIAKLRILIEILDALAYAHDEGIIHRDIKPSNVWVQPNGKVKLLDFGLARLAHLDALTLPGEVMGTPYYMSPEQLKGQTVDGRTDVFSTGVLGYELLSRRRAFDGESITAIIIKVLGETPPPIGTAWSAAFPEVDAIIARAMAKSPDERYGSARDMADALRQFVDAHRDDIPRIEAEVTRESSAAVQDAETLIAQGLTEQATARLSAALRRDPDAVTVRGMLAPPTEIIGQRPGASGSAAAPAAAAVVPSAPPPATLSAGQPSAIDRAAAMTPPHIITIPRGGTTTVRQAAAVDGREAALPTQPLRAIAESPVAERVSGVTAADAPSNARGGWWKVAAGVVLALGLGAYFVNTYLKGESSAPTNQINALSQPATTASPPPSTEPPTVPPVNQSASAATGVTGVASAAAAGGDAAGARGGGDTSAAGAASAASSIPADRAGGGRLGGRQDAQGRAGRRAGGGIAPGVALEGVGISPESNAILRPLVANKLFNEAGLPRPVRAGEARWLVSLAGEITLRPSPLGNGALTADYTGDVQVADRLRGRIETKQFEGHVMDFGQNPARQKSARELADKMADFIVSIVKSRNPRP